MKKVFSVIIIFSMVSSLSTPSFAANSSWISTGVTGPGWNNSDNWSLGFVPGATAGTTDTDIATFNTAVGNFGISSTPIIIDSGRNIGGINFDTAAGNYTIGSTSLNPLLLTSGGTIQILNTLTATNAVETLNAPLVIEGVAGTYTLANDSASGTGAGAGTLNIGGGITGGATGAAVLTLSGSNTNSNTISGIIANGTATSVAITKSGAGLWVLSGANTYTGTTTVSAGTLEAGVASQAFGVGSDVTVASGATLDLGGNSETIGSLAGAGTVTSSQAGSVILTTGGAGDNTSTAFSGNIANGSGIVGLTLEGTGTLTLSGANTYTGATTVSAGTLEAGIVNSAFGVGSAVSVASGATLDLGGFNETIGSLAGAGTVTNSGVTSPAILTAGGDNTSTAFSGNIVDGTSTIGLTKDGSGTLTLSGNNTYTGDTTLDAGTLNLGSGNAIGAGTINFDGGTLQYSASNTTDYSGQFSSAAGQAFNIDTNGQDVIFANPLGSGTSDTLTKIGSGTLTLTGANTYSGSTAIYGGSLQIGNGGVAGSLGTGDVTDNANLTFDLTSSPTISNAIFGTGTVTQNGTGTLTFSGANTYSGATTVNTGTLKAGIVDQAFGLGSAVAVAVGGTFDLGGLNETIGSLAGAGTVTNSGVTSPAILTAGGDNTSTTFSGSLEDGTSTIGLTKDGSGTLTLSGTNTYSGATTLNAGILDVASGAMGSGTINFDGGTLQYGSGNTTDYSGQFNTAAGQAFNIDTNGQDVTFTTALGSGTSDALTKFGSGTLTLTAANSYTGGTTINGGTLTIGPGGSISSTGALSVNNTNTGAGNGVVMNLSTTAPTTTGSLSGAIATPSSGSNTATIDNGGQLFTVNQTTDGTYAGVIAGAGGFNLGNSSSSKLLLSGDNTYSGGTSINAGVLQVGNPNALGTGAVVNNATLALGTTNLSLGAGSSYTQSIGSALYLTAVTASIYGSITSTVAASVASGSSINVTIGGYVQNGSVLEIIDSGGTGIGSAPSTVTSTSSLVSFTSSILNNNLILTASNSGFAPLGNSPNARAIGTVLDNISNPSTDMTNVLNTLAVLSNAKITSALNTMGPVVDGGVIQNSSASLNNLISTTLDRVQSSLDHTASENPVSTGVSSGDESQINGVWAKPYGSYLTQGTLQGIQGYDAWNAGTVIGYDHMVTDAFTLGVSGSYAYGQVNSDANSANTIINSGQGTVYAGYQDPNFNYFIDAMGTFGWNWYDGQRDILIGSLNRTADADYQGQQYGAYLGGGYKINLGDSLQFTPLASIQWTRLFIPHYTETNASSLDLNVSSQSYDILESGLGASIAYPVKCDWGNFTPEFHAKWLHDFINDDMTVTSSFAGGGGSFTSNGATPAKEGADIGGKLSFDFNNNLSLIAQLDTELKDQFFGVYASGTLQYKF